MAPSSRNAQTSLSLESGNKNNKSKASVSLKSGVWLELGQPTRWRPSLARAVARPQGIAKALVASICTYFSYWFYGQPSTKPNFYTPTLAPFDAPATSVGRLHMQMPQRHAGLQRDLDLIC